MPLRRHLIPVPANLPSVGPDPARSATAAAVGAACGITGEAITQMFLRARAAGARITVERFERDDGTQVIHLDATDIVAFIYIGQRPGSHSGLDPVVIDLHRRTEAGERRLQVMLDNADARLLTIDPAQFATKPSSPQDGHGWDLICARCDQRLGPLRHGGLLQSLLDLASSHTCPDPVELGEARNGTTGMEQPC